MTAPDRGLTAHDEGMTMTHEGTDELGALLTAAAPPAVADRALLTALSGELAREVVAADRGLHARLRRVRRRHRVAVAAAAAAVVLAPPAAWAAQHFLAQTGTFGNPALNPGMDDASEKIDVCAQDFTDYVATLAPTDLPVPPGHSWREYAGQSAREWSESGDCTPGQQGLVQETGLRLGLLSRASADWGCTLVWATRDGDRPAAASARSTMLSIDARAHRLSPVEGSVSTWDPAVFLANSRLPQFTGCAR
jgi:hypothetical protein